MYDSLPPVVDCVKCSDVLGQVAPYESEGKSCETVGVCANKEV